MNERNHPRLPMVDVEVKAIRNSAPRAHIMINKLQFASVASHAMARKIDNYKSVPNRFRPALEAAADYIRQMIGDVFEQEGPGWAPLAPRTQMERAWQGYQPQHPILQRSGDLMSELTEKSHPKHIEVIKTGRNARIEIGGSSRKFVENQMGDRRARLPQRSMIPGIGGTPFSMEDKKNIESIIGKSIRQQMGLKPKGKK